MTDEGPARGRLLISDGGRVWEGVGSLGANAAGCSWEIHKALRANTVGTISWNRIASWEVGPLPPSDAKRSDDFGVSVRWDTGYALLVNVGPVAETRYAHLTREASRYLPKDKIKLPAKAQQLADEVGTLGSLGVSYELPAPEYLREIGNVVVARLRDSWLRRPEILDTARTALAKQGGRTDLHTAQAVVNLAAWPLLATARERMGSAELPNWAIEHNHLVLVRNYGAAEPSALRYWFDQAAYSFRQPDPAAPRQEEAAPGPAGPQAMLALIKAINAGFQERFGVDTDRWNRLSGTFAEGWLNKRVEYLLGDGWDAAVAAVTGHSADAIAGFARAQLEQALVPRVTALGTPQVVNNAINDGLKRAALIGWLAGYAWWQRIDGWQPSGWDANAAILTAETTSALNEFDPATLPDEVFYVLQNYTGQTVYRFTLKELGVPADDVLTDGDLAQVVHRGGDALSFGWLLAEQQHRLGW